MSKERMHYTFTATDNVDGNRATLETDLVMLPDLIRDTVVPLLVAMGFAQQDVLDSMAEVSNPELVADDEP